MMGLMENRGMLISIHSLVKRETFASSLSADATGISIHSLVKRETAEIAKRTTENGDFNPLPRKEGDDND